MADMLARKMMQVPVGELVVHPENPRRGNVKAIKASIEANGFANPLIVQKATGHVIAGNHRLIAARELGMAKVPVVYIDVDDDQARRLMLADNRTAQLGGFDHDRLRSLLDQLGATDSGLLGTSYSRDDVRKLVRRQQDAQAKVRVEKRDAGSDQADAEKPARPAQRRITMPMNVDAAEAFSQDVETLRSRWGTVGVVETVIRAVHESVTREA